MPMRISAAAICLMAQGALAQITQITAMTAPASQLDLDALPPGPVTIAQLNAAGTGGSAALAAITMPDKPTAAPGIYNANLTFGRALGRVGGAMTIIDNDGSAPFDATTFIFDLQSPHTEFGVGVADWNGSMVLQFYNGAALVGDILSSEISQLRPIIYFRSTQPFTRVVLDVDSAAGNFVVHELWTAVGQPSACYPNCDESTTAPILNVDDFTCFINNYAAAGSLPHAQQLTHYANCDLSTVAPVLNVDDFTCFINAFAAGCP